jgi:hypothetical protein
MRLGRRVLHGESQEGRASMGASRHTGGQTKSEGERLGKVKFVGMGGEH